MSSASPFRPGSGVLTRSGSGSGSGSRRPFAVALVALVVGLALGPLPGQASAAPSSAMATPTQWSVQPTPPIDAISSGLQGIDCTSATHCVAVGGSGPNGTEQPLIEVWNGSEWAVQNAAPPGDGLQGSLQSVSCVRESFCMAVGIAARTDVFLPFIETWNGSDWSVVPAPSVGSGHNVLERVDCASSTFCVAVGFAAGAVDNEGLVLTWDGADWTIATMPSLAPAGSLFTGVSCPGIDDCRIVGYRYDGGSVPLVERWNGIDWQIEAIPTMAPNSYLADISCVDASNCMVVGEHRSGVGSKGLSMVLHDGTWELQPDVTFGEEQSSFAAVSCADAAHCVGVGRATRVTVAALVVDPLTPVVDTEYPPPIATWDGSAWTVDPDPAGGFVSIDLSLVDVSCPTTINCLTVGSTYDRGRFRPLALGTVVPPAPPPPPEPLVPAFTG